MSGLTVANGWRWPIPSQAPHFVRSQTRKWRNEGGWPRRMKGVYYERYNRDYINVFKRNGDDSEGYS